MDILNATGASTSKDTLQYKYAGGDRDVLQFRNATANPYDATKEPKLFAAYNAGYNDQDPPKDDVELDAWIAGHRQHTAEYKHMPVKAKAKGFSERFAAVMAWNPFKPKHKNASGGVGDIKLKHVVVILSVGYLIYKRNDIKAFFGSVGHAAKQVKI